MERKGTPGYRKEPALDTLFGPQLPGVSGTIAELGMCQAIFVYQSPAKEGCGQKN
ncbi:MAG: hypothetical protein GY697_02295 [Desulfobacterales bacterium]|nr:hypothetical protein [Desulfobacterales bacterium]